MDPRVRDFLETYLKVFKVFTRSTEALEGEG